jgi:hypothetical protein
MLALQTVQETAAPILNEIATLPSTKTKVYTQPPEPYTVTSDGHLVGADGFIVPRDYSEFIETFPRHVRNFVRSKMPGSSTADQEDRESELQIRLLVVPLTSKYRTPGFNGRVEGCSDRIQTFIPELSGGASKPRFLDFVNRILWHEHIKFIMKSVKKSVNPIERVNNLVYFPGPSDKGCTAYINDERLHYMVASVRKRASRCQNWMETRVVIQELAAYVTAREPDLIPVLYTFLDSQTYIEAQRDLGLSDQLFLRVRRRLDILIQCWVEGVEPPRQRKVYRPRTKKVPETEANKSDDGLVSGT